MAGAVLAERLSEDRRRSVLLPEAGPDYPDLDAMPADPRNGNNPRRSVYDPGARTWGGTGRDPTRHGPRSGCRAATLYAIIPRVAIFLTVLSLNIVGDSPRDRLDRATPD